MKFTVSSQTLLKKLTSLSGVVSPSNVLPILDCFLFQLDKNCLKISSSDLETTMTGEVEVTSVDTGSIAIQSQLLIEVLKTFPELPITFTVNEKKAVELSSELGKYKLVGYDGLDFPKASQINDPTSIKMDQQVLLKAITKTLFAVGDDLLRPAMCGVFIAIDQNGITFVSTDTHKLSKYNTGEAKSDKINSYIIPKKPLSLLKNLLQVGEVNIEYNSSNVSFVFADTKIVTKLIDSKYPNYDAVIPKNNPNILKIDRKGFLESIRRVSVFSNKSTSQICLGLTKDNIEVKAEDLDYSNEAHENMKCEYAGSDLKIGFNAKYLVEVLNGFDTQEVIFELSEPTRAGIMRPFGADEKDNLMMLVMPVMMQS